MLLNLGLLIMVLLIDMFQIKREILIFSLSIYNHRTTKTNQKYPSVNL